MTSKTTQNLETNLEQLKKIVEQMEQNLSLDDALAQFEQGIRLVRESQEMLSHAEQKISILLNKDGQSELEPFNNEDAS